MKNIGFLLLFAMLLFSACRKNIEKIIVEETQYVPEILEKWEQDVQNVKGDLTGFVADEFGTPVIAATVKMGNLMTTTDTYGHFFFKNVQMNAKGSFVRVEKSGYFPGSRRFFAIKDVENRVKIELMAKSFSESFEAQNGGTVNIAGGSSIVFAPNSIQMDDGTAYSGIVKVAAKWLDPTDPHTLDRMPGNLQGVDRLSEEVVMTTFGMIVAELQSEAGEKLNILKGKTATIKMPVPVTLLANAPAEIPLWSYHESYGMWAEEGLAKLENGFYVGDVSHFSYWNCDIPGNFIKFTANFINVDGASLVNFKVGINVVGTSQTGYGYTDADGTTGGAIPKNENLELQVYNACNEIIYSIPIGPFSSDVDLGQITIPNSSLNSTTIIGQLVDCNANPIPHGLVKFSFSGQTIYKYTDGTPFTVVFSTCVGTTNIEIIGVDLDELKQSDPLQSSVNGTFNIGNVEICNVQLQDYVKVTVNGVSKTYIDAMLYIPQSLDSIYILSQDSSNAYMHFVIAATTAGTYGNSANGFSLFDSSHLWGFNVQSFDNVTISEYGGPNQPIKGFFSGTMQNTYTQPAQTVTVTGEFSVLND